MCRDGGGSNPWRPRGEYWPRGALIRPQNPTSLRSESGAGDSLRCRLGIYMRSVEEGMSVTGEGLRQAADGLDALARSGAVEDVPEGRRVVEMSDTLARRLAEDLRS